MIKVKEVGSKVTPAKKNITISDVAISDDNFVDEEGSIMNRLVEALPCGEDTKFTIKISIDLPDEKCDDSDE